MFRKGLSAVYSFWARTRQYLKLGTQGGGLALFCCCLLNVFIFTLCTGVLPAYMSVYSTSTYPERAFGPLEGCLLLMWVTQPLKGELRPLF